MRIVRLAVISFLVVVWVVVWLAVGIASADEFYADGTCVNEAGDPGIWSISPPCYTTEVYDEVFSIENLTEVYGEETVETWNLPDDTLPSDRELGAGLAEETFTFKEAIERSWGSVYPT